MMSKKILFEKDIPFIKQKLEEGLLLREIAEIYGAKPSTFRNFVLKHNISHIGITSNKKNNPYFVEEVKKLNDKGYSLREISKKTHLSIATLTRMVKENDIVPHRLKNSKMDRYKMSYLWTDEDEKTFISMCLSGQYSQNDIAIFFGISKPTVYTKRKQLKINDKKMMRSNSETDFQKQYVISNYPKMSIQELSEKFCISEEHLQKRMLKWGVLNKAEVVNTFLRPEMPITKDFQTDYINPYMTHATMSIKYGIPATKIGHWRRKDFGNTFLANKSIPNTGTQLENQLEKILESLDICFKKGHSIGHYRPDFYLGQKIIIECDGVAYHCGDNELKTTKRNLYYANHGYYLFIVTDDDIFDNQLKQEIMNFYINAVQSQISLKTLDH